MMKVPSTNCVFVIGSVWVCECVSVLFAFVRFYAMSKLVNGRNVSCLLPCVLNPINALSIAIMATNWFYSDKIILQSVGPNVDIGKMSNTYRNWFLFHLSSNHTKYIHAIDTTIFFDVYYKLLFNLINRWRTLFNRI